MTRQLRTWPLAKPLYIVAVIVQRVEPIIDKPIAILEALSLILQDAKSRVAGKSRPIALLGGCVTDDIHRKYYNCWSCVLSERQPLQRSQKMPIK